MLKNFNKITAKAISRMIEHPQENTLIVSFNAKRKTTQIMPKTNRMIKKVKTSIINIAQHVMGLNFRGVWRKVWPMVTGNSVPSAAI